MEMPVLKIPRVVPLRAAREPSKRIPQTRIQREQIRAWVQAYALHVKPVPPLPIDELRGHCDRILEMHGIDAIHRDYVAVLLNGELWRESLASVPFERRLLLLPKCLRWEDKCPATFDEYGLLCKQCGLCAIQDLQNEAEKLGYAVLIAEGSAIVMQIIRTGKVDAIIGVSCLSVLERAFPYMESAAIPGVAIPLLQDDCRDTSVDMEWVWDVIHLTSNDRTYRLNLDAMRQEVDGWFEPEVLDEILGPTASQTERIARAWLGKSGKRWRPFLAACAYKALCDEPDAPLPPSLRKLAVAVECFHKASLVHDDIEDDDAIRYGEKTVHAEHGIPVALNVGDLLLGDGYRMIAECDAPAEARARMLEAAAAGHRTLCVGQGAELCWMREPRVLSPTEVLDIFRKKTAPAFEVALKLGAAYAGADAGLWPVIARYCEALGIAYQVRDDLEDLSAGGDSDDIAGGRPSLPLALAYERSRGEDRTLLERAWRRSAGADAVGRVRQLIHELGIEDRCRGLLESYKQEAVRSLADVESHSFKGLLRRVISRIFSVQVKGWCSEFEARNAASREVGAKAAG